MSTESRSISFGDGTVLLMIFTVIVLAVAIWALFKSWT